MSELSFAGVRLRGARGGSDGFGGSGTAANGGGGGALDDFDSIAHDGDGGGAAHDGGGGGGAHDDENSDMPGDGAEY